MSGLGQGAGLVSEELLQELLRDARRYRWIRQHTAPAELAMHACLDAGGVIPSSEGISDRVDKLCDAGLERGEPEGL